MIKVTRAILHVYGLPAGYLGVDYKDTVLPKAKQQDIEEKIKKAPIKGLLAIQGTAAPIVNQLLLAGRKVRGICFTERSSTAFETHQNPIADVVVLYDVGSEVSLNGKVSGMVLASIIKFYAGRDTLLILETEMTKASLLQRYDFDVINFLKIPHKAETSWI